MRSAQPAWVSPAVVCAERSLRHSQRLMRLTRVDPPPSPLPASPDAGTAGPSPPLPPGKVDRDTRLVVEDSSPEYKSLPGVRRHFESLQLTNDLERAMLAAHLRPRSDVLPPQQPIHEL